MNETAGTDLEYVGFWLRVAATIIDTLLILAFTLPILFAIYGEEYISGTRQTTGFWDLVLSWILPAIAVILFWRYRSATPGKMAISAKIVDAKTGGRPNLRQFMIRYVGYFLSIIPLLVGYLWVAFDARK